MKNITLFSALKYFKNMLVLMLFSLILTPGVISAQDKSMARIWNEQLLETITYDSPRPTVHSRNLFHSSAVMYDAWAAYDPTSDPYLLGQTRGDFTSTFEGVAIPSDPADLKAAREEAMSFAIYRLMLHRFQNSMAYDFMEPNINALMDSLNYDRFNESVDYINGGPAELGNYIAQEMIDFGHQDGANEINNYANQVYVAMNDTIKPELPGNPTCTNPNLWQPISLSDQEDQAGNAIYEAPPFVGAEWGEVVPFAMTDDDMVVKTRDGIDWRVYKDPGAPALLDTAGFQDWEVGKYKWSFLMVAIWQGHLDPEDDTEWDISPASRGNLGGIYPTDYVDYDTFYNYFEGNDQGQGYDVNPATGEPYEPQMIRRGDYARVLAEFWADGPKSYTPPGHWYEISNDAVLSHPDLELKWMGVEDMDRLEYETKYYLTLGGAVHDAAVSAWGIKGYYDYIRPVSAIRYMCDKGQCTDTEADNYDPLGVPLIPGYIEVVEEGDPLAGEFNQHVGKIKLYTWKGHDYIEFNEEGDEALTYAGAGWILGETWWPYQRPSFVSPPFAGFISGHSCFSSTAAATLTAITGDPYFPGGVGEFEAEQNEFLKFEEGPSETVTLQWATYRDASDQCSLSRIWGGIHPPIDDIHGRLIGLELGPQAVDFANTLFDADRPTIVSVVASQDVLNISDIGNQVTLTLTFDREMDIAIEPMIQFLGDDPMVNSLSLVSGQWLSDTEYALTYELLNGQEKLANIFMQIDNAEDVGGRTQNAYVSARPITIDTDRPEVTSVTYDETVLNDAIASESWLLFTIELDEQCDTTTVPTILFDSETDLDGSLFFLSGDSYWVDEFTYQAVYDLVDNNEEVADIGLIVMDIPDKAGNAQNDFIAVEQFDIDTRNPEFMDVASNENVLNIQMIGNNALQVTLEFDESMDTDEIPTFVFTNDDPMGTSLILNQFSSDWTNDQSYVMSFNLQSIAVEYFDIVIDIQGFYDLAGNIPAETTLDQLFVIDTKRPEITAVTPSDPVISDSEVGMGVYYLEIQYEESMNQDQLPVVALSADSDISGSVVFNPFGSSWLDEFTFQAAFNVNDENIEVSDIDSEVAFGRDASGNFQDEYNVFDEIQLDTRNPEALLLNANTYEVTASHIGPEGFNLLSVFDESMIASVIPVYEFIGPIEVASLLTVNNGASGWINSFTYQTVYDVGEEETLIEDIGLDLSAARDLAGNEVVNILYDDFFAINTTTVGLEDETAHLGLSFYPNPVKKGQMLMFGVENELQAADIRIISSSGKTIYQQHFSQLNPGVHNLELNEVRAGLYFIQIQSSEGTLSHKLVVLD